MVLPLRDENPTRATPYVTLAIIVACLAIFAFVQHATEDERFEFRYAAIPCEITHDRPLTVLEAPTNVAEAQGGPFACNKGPDAPELFPHKNVYLAAIASMFLHASWLHVLGNLLFLWIFGNNVEERFGSIAYVFFYVIGGLVALGAHVLSNPSSADPVLGASGAIAAVMGAYLVWWPRARVLSIVPPIFFLPFYLPAYVVLGLWFVLQFFTAPSTGVAWVAHVGGFAFGALVALLYKGRRGSVSRQQLVQPEPFHPGDHHWPGGYRGIGES
jgi:membrane associated rhomboid family serine protease